MAAAFTLLAKDREGPSITFQVLFYHVIDANFDTSSYVKYQEGYWLTREAMKWFWNNYTSDQTNRKEPTVSPLQASLDQLKGLPPARVINGENDVLCVMKAKLMLVSYWRLVYGLLQFDIMVQFTTL
jgi:acetyl esterase